MRHYALIFLLISWPATAKTLIFAAPQADPAEYRAYVLSNPVYDFPSHSLLENLPSQSAHERLAEHFSRAQISFAEGSIVEAISEFKAVVALAPTDHWSREDQTALLHSYLRLAQLEQGTAADEWLKWATIWAPDGKLEPRLFPPPLVEKFYIARKSATRITVSLSRFVHDFHFILINGEKFDLTTIQQIELPDGPIHSSFLSDTYMPVVADIPASNLGSYIPEIHPWVEGGCLHSNIHWAESQPTAKAFFDLRCASPAIARLKPVPVPVMDDSPPEPVGFLPPVPAKPPIYRRTWFWAGVGAALVATVLVIQGNQHKSPPQPTSTEGF